MGWDILSQFSIQDYFQHLASKGIKLKESDTAFIEFGKQFTGMSDYMVSISIEITLKVQREFDGSYYIALLEGFKENNITTKKKAYAYVNYLELELTV
ncbi:hypothetical protein SAMN04488137_1408 [Fictibacillus solisalsi]|uniref:Uncharacterized protein n=1 Tax=Fictibacillus solisalsi TaxID=459525 RepID=A0A1G9V7K8_9BACL|nr:hypothetical protein SAMN04488137_1408 [Fictibacillus solisalsi]